jgi:hypothetical protein
MILQCICSIWIEYTLQKNDKDTKSEPLQFASTQKSHNLSLSSSIT